MTLHANKVTVQIARDDGQTCTVGHRADFAEHEIMTLQLGVDRQAAPVPLSGVMVAAILAVKRVLGGTVTR